MTWFRIARVLILAIVVFGAGLLHAQEPTTALSDVQLPIKEDFHIYLLMGQSNMVGRDTRGMEVQTPNAHILAMTPNGKWMVAKDPLHEQNGRIAPGVGPGMSFAQEMIKSDPSITIGLVPCAVGGTPLKLWVKGGELYEKAMLRAKAAAEVGTLSGVLWHQGETDATKKESADTYEARLTKMLGDLRTELNAPNLPIVVGQIGEFLDKKKEPYADTVRAAIKHIPQVLEQVGFADSNGLTDKGDKLHFNVDSQRQMGVRFANAMLELQGKPHSSPTTLP